MTSGQWDNESHSIHLSHAARTERFKDFVMTEGFADHADGFLPELGRQDSNGNASTRDRGVAQLAVRRISTTSAFFDGSSLSTWRPQASSASRFSLAKS